MKTHKLDISLIFTGNFNINHNTLFLKNLNNYLLYFDKIIISIWEDNIIPNELLTMAIHHPNIIIIRVDDLKTDNIIDPTFIHYSLQKQVYPIIKCLEKVKTTYVVRSRMDCTFENIDKVVNRFFSCPDKILFGSVAYDPDNPSSNGFLHIGDQLIITRTDIFSRGFQELFESRKTYNEFAFCEYLFLYYLLKSKYHYEKYYCLNINNQKWSTFIDKELQFMPYLQINANHDCFREHIQIYNYSNLGKYQYKTYNESNDPFITNGNY